MALGDLQVLKGQLQLGLHIAQVTVRDPLELQDVHAMHIGQRVGQQVCPMQAVHQVQRLAADTERPLRIGGDEGLAQLETGQHPCFRVRVALEHAQQAVLLGGRLGAEPDGGDRRQQDRP